MTKAEKQNIKMQHKVALALSRFAAELLGRPDEYKSPEGYINLYPSDVLYHWGYRHIDKDGRIIENPELEPLNVAGVTCGGCVKMNDTPRVLTVWFEDLK